MSAEQGITFGEILTQWLPPEDLIDMDDELEREMREVAGVNGAIILPPIESVQRIRDPLSPETLERFGDFIMEALQRTDLDD